MAEIIAVAEQLGYKWLLALLVIVLVVDKTGIVWKSASYWIETRSAERTNLAQQREQLFDEFRTELTRNSNVVENLRTRLEKKDDIIISVERGNSRLRHALLNVHQYVAILRSKLEEAGIEIPRYEGWKNDLELDDVLVERVRSVYDKERTENRTEGDSE